MKKVILTLAVIITGIMSHAQVDSVRLEQVSLTTGHVLYFHIE